MEGLLASNVSWENVFELLTDSKFSSDQSRIIVRSPLALVLDVMMCHTQTLKHIPKYSIDDEIRECP